MITPRRTLLRQVLTVAGACAALAACSAVVPPPGMKPPSLTIQSLGIKELGLNQIVFSVMLNANNPNSHTMPLSDARLELSLLGEKIASGTTPTGKFELAAGGSTSLPVEFTVPTRQVISLVRRLGQGNWAQLSYELKGQARWGVLGLPVSFERKGELDALRKLNDMIR